MEPTHHQHNPTDPGQLRAWITKWIAASWLWHAKILSGPETSATQTRRPGPRVPTALLKPAFPSLTEDARPPTVEFDIEIDSHGVRHDQVRAVPHIGHSLPGAPRLQMRITNTGTSSPLLDPENTGALTIFVCRPGPGTNSPKCRIWICRNPTETDVADDLLGPVEPGFPAPWAPA